MESKNNKQRDIDWGTIKKSIAHIFESGANEKRIFDLIELILFRELKEKTVIVEGEKRELLLMLKDSVREINHLKNEYKDSGHAVRFLKNADVLIQSIES